MSNEKLVSVIMPAFNVDQYIAEAVESVQKQSYQDWELIIIDDGSTDNTRAVAEKFSSVDARIRCISTENMGVSAARNIAVAQAKGMYISFLDADDLWHEDFLQETMTKISHGGAIVYSRTMECFQDGRSRLLGPKKCIVGSLDAFIYKGYDFRPIFHISALLIKKSLIDEYRIIFPIGIKNAEDLCFFIQILSVTEINFVPKVLTYYRRRKDSATTQKWNPDNQSGTVKIFIFLEDFFKKNQLVGIHILHHLRNYNAYRFILNGLRFGFYEQMKFYIEEWKPWLLEFSHGKGRITDKIKCSLIAHNSMKLNMFIGKIS